jgi:enterochelin esterase family protein
VALAHELRRPRRVPFERRGRAWHLEWPRPDAHRVEYLLELTHRSGSKELVPDPGNPLRAPGPFGEKSVLEFPGYAPPAWLADEDAPVGDLREVRLGRHRPLQALLWSAAETDPAEPLPLVVVHDGPEYAQYSQLLRLLDHLVSFGDVPPLRAALVPPRGDRNESYSGSTRYARLLADVYVTHLRELAPSDTAPVGMGASLGALGMLHAQRLHPHAFGGLFLQSGSYFTRRYDSHEARFGRFGRITRVVGRIAGGRGAVVPIPVTITCGSAEENLENNRTMAEILARQGYDVRLVETRDAHNWVAWRDALHPHLAELFLRTWT